MKNWLPIPSILLFMTPISSTLAQTIDFTDGICHNQTICVKTINGGNLDGTTATFSNPIVMDNPPPMPPSPDVFFNLSDGLALGSGGLGISWDVVFDSDVAWIGGSIGNVFNAGGTINTFGFDVNGPGVNASALLPNATVGPFSINPTLVFTAGETYTFTQVLNNLPGGQSFATLNFEQVSSISVPEPSSATMLLGLISLFLFRKKRK